MNINTSMSALLMVAAIFQVSCSSTDERDGRQYHGSASPLQGKMGVTFKRVQSTIQPVTTNVDAPPPAPRSVENDGLLGVLTGTPEGPPGPARPQPETR